MNFKYSIAKSISGGKISYSQCGEDLIINFMFKSMGINRPTYLDIGAYDPIELSNTYLFYLQGSRGVCIEPDPHQCQKIKLHRPEDKCLNIGIGKKKSEPKDFYVMSNKTLSTFSKSTALQLAKESQYAIADIIKIPLNSINQIISDHFNDSLDLISLDTEGIDEQILTSMNFSNSRPKVFCVETINFLASDAKHKTSAISSFMSNNGYTQYAHTHINTIFIDNNFLE